MSDSQTTSSIRNPVLLWSVSAVAVATLVTLLFASNAVRRGTLRAYRVAVHQRLAHQLATRTATTVASEGMSDLEMAVVTHDAENPWGMRFWEAQLLVEEGEISDLVSVPVRVRGRAAFLVARIRQDALGSITAVEITRIVPFAVLTTLLVAGLVAFVVGRLFRPSLEALARLAQQSRRRTSMAELDTSTPAAFSKLTQQIEDTLANLSTEKAQALQERQALEEMQAALIRTAKFASVGRLAAGIAHELGNPLSAIKGYVSLLQSGAIKAEASQDVLKRSAGELDRMQSIIQTLLTYAKGGEVKSAPAAAFSTRAVLNDAIALLEGHQAFHGIALRVAPDHAWETELKDAVGHPDGLRQVLVNLLINAAHALTDSSDGQIRVSWHHSDTAITIDVQDNGPGISAEDAPRLFDPFFSTKAPGQGAGLGLAVSSALMEGMGGALVLESSKPGQTVFVVQLMASAAGQ